MDWSKLLAILGTFILVFLVCVYTWGGEAGQEAASSVGAAVGIIAFIGFVFWFIF